MINIDRYYFLWLQNIANICKEFKVKVYNENISIYFKNVKELYILSKSKEKLYSRVRNKGVSSKVLSYLTDRSIKVKTFKLYKKIKKNNLNIITIKDKSYPNSLNNIDIAPFCIITTNNVKLNRKNVLLYYDNNFTNFSKKLTDYFSKIILSQNCNVISKFSSQKLPIIKLYNIKKLEKNIEINENCIIFPNNIDVNEYIIYISDILIIIEASYNEDIVILTNSMLDIGKDIYVVPQTIFRRSSYFSNFLIKQGADIILNRGDLMFILTNRIG